MSDSFFPVILCGGSGTRLWPMSRRALPKQFLPLATDRTMLQDTALRLRGLEHCLAPVVVSNEEHRFLVAEQLREIGVSPEVQILEPQGRNTAPAIAAAALYCRQKDPAAMMLVLPSDHLVRDTDVFRRAVANSVRIATSGLLVTFGIPPSGPETGYGYIQQGEPLPSGADVRDLHAVHRVRRFVEKPDALTARSFLVDGGYFWNSGMFAFSPVRYLDELGRFRPEILAAAGAAFEKSVRDLDFLRLDAQAFAQCPSESADYAVMEHTASAVVVAADMGWSDVGSWSALWEVSEKDAAGNVVRGDVDLADVRRSYVRADDRHVSVLGVEDLVVVETGDAVLVAGRDRAQEVKEVVERLKDRNRTEHVSHSRVYRPWGYYESVDAGDRFQVKRIMVKPGESLSLQMHRQRAEHWVVVSGIATVTRGEEVVALAENQSTYIPIGMKHRLENRGGEPLYLIEVQSGAYLGEDDIVRFEDRYRRS